MSRRIRSRHATQIRQGILDAKEFVAKGRTISKGYIFFRSDNETLHGRAFQRTLRRLDTRDLGHYQRRVEYMDGHIEHVNRIYRERQPNACLPGDWRYA